MRKLGERTARGLIRVVGYENIEEAVPVSRSTIERAWRGPWKDGDPRLPEPSHVRGRALWPVFIVNDWLFQHFRGMAPAFSERMQAVLHGNSVECSIEELNEQARSLAANALSKELGKPIDPDTLELHLTQAIGEDEFIEHIAAEHEILLKALKALSVEHAAVLVVRLLPQLRAQLEATTDQHGRAALLDAGSASGPTILDCSNFLNLIEVQETAEAATGRELEEAGEGDTTNGGAHAPKRHLGLGESRSMVLAAWMFPDLAPHLMRGVSAVDRQLFADQALLERAAAAATDDAAWAVIDGELAQMQGQAIKAAAE